MTADHDKEWWIILEFVAVDYLPLLIHMKEEVESFLVARSEKYESAVEGALHLENAQALEGQARQFHFIGIQEHF